MFKKLFVLILLLAGLQLLDACCDSKPYFDYKKLLVESAFVPLTATGDTVLAMTVSPDQIEYIAMVQPLRLTTPAYGNSCPDPGESGPKSAMAMLEIQAEQSFNDTLPAGKSLNNIFFDARSTSTSTPISKMDISNFEFILPQWNFVVYTKLKPKLLSETYSFVVKVTKADGTIVQGRVTGVKFK